MAKVLYITAHPLTEEQSFSLAAGKAFIDTYKNQNQNDEIIHLDLFKENIPHIDADVLGGWGKLQKGTEFSALSADEHLKVGRLAELVDQFTAADKFVFVTPLWNFSFPPVIQIYTGRPCRFDDRQKSPSYPGSRRLLLRRTGSKHGDGKSLYRNNNELLRCTFNGMPIP